MSEEERAKFEEKREEFKRLLDEDWKE